SSPDGVTTTIIAKSKAAAIRENRLKAIMQELENKKNNAGPVPKAVEDVPLPEGGMVVQRRLSAFEERASRKSSPGLRSALENKKQIPTLASQPEGAAGGVASERGRRIQRKDSHFQSRSSRESASSPRLSASSPRASTTSPRVSTTSPRVSTAARVSAQPGLQPLPSLPESQANGISREGTLGAVSSSFENHESSLLCVNSEGEENCRSSGYAEEDDSRRSSGVHVDGLDECAGKEHPLEHAEEVEILENTKPEGQRISRCLSSFEERRREIKSGIDSEDDCRYSTPTRPRTLIREGSRVDSIVQELERSSGVDLDGDGKVSGQEISVRSNEERPSGIKVRRCLTSFEDVRRLRRSASLSSLAQQELLDGVDSPDKGTSTAQSMSARAEENSEAIDKARPLLKPNESLQPKIDYLESVMGVNDGPALQGPGWSRVIPGQVRSFMPNKRAGSLSAVPPNWSDESKRGPQGNSAPSVLDGQSYVRAARMDGAEHSEGVWQQPPSLETSEKPRCAEM
ncbi:MAG: hypothetical protein SGPRY_012179, partial [Prymnesium sp.]